MRLRSHKRPSRLHNWTHRAPNQLQVKGTLMAEDCDEKHELCVINTDGSLQRAASFHEYMQQLLIELSQLRLALLDEFPADPNVSDMRCESPRS